jgi:predicted RNase H-like HicB family nuclease
MSDYIALIHKDLDSEYGVSFPDFPGCVTAGSSIDEAKDMAKEALAGHVQTMIDYGDNILAPSRLESIMADPENADVIAFLVVTVPDPNPKSVRVNITVPENTLRQIDAAAKKLGMSRSSFLVRAAKNSLHGE